MLAAKVMAAEETGTLVGGPLPQLARYSTTVDAVAAGLCFVGRDGRDVVFTAEVHPVSPDLCLLHSVWMAPDHRGQGRSASAVASVIGLAQRLAPAIALFVDERNERARRCYLRVGFESVGTALCARTTGKCRDELVMRWA